MRTPVLTVPMAVMLIGCGVGGKYDMDMDNDQGFEVSGPDYSVNDEDLADTNPWVETSDDPMSTFSVDVDSGSYTLTRRTLNEGSLPDAKEVRVEEFINYFHYDDARPEGDLPFEVTLEAAPSMFGHDDDIYLMRIGIQAEEIPLAERDPVNLVFLLDVSGSMSSPDKLGLVVYAMKQLVDKLSPEDTLGIVVYAGSDGILLESTPVHDKSTILDALDKLQAGGATNGEAGIRTAYNMAERNFHDDGVNRVVLCTDGDFNVGLEGPGLIDLIENFRDRGIFLTTLGFGMGNYQDGTMEQLADNGNGNYAYIDTHNEATRVLGENLVSTLQVVAKDVKVQVEFEANTVERWRLIGYENRILDHDDFDDDSVDAGDIGAGHHVTALYEIDLTDSASADDLAKVRLRYKEPKASESTEHFWSIDGADRLSSFDAASADLQFSAAVAEFAEILRDSEHSEGARFDDIADVVFDAAPNNTRTELKDEFIGLVGKAAAMWP
ncbi:MAG: DUF3520 domain-containing protein [Proteobacteria bacterium]|nr:DUF3520 domain-containing protein [Pseudomonadota bacterium]